MFIHPRARARIAHNMHVRSQIARSDETDDDYYLADTFSYTRYNNR